MLQVDEMLVIRHDDFIVVGKCGDRDRVFPRLFVHQAVFRRRHEHAQRALLIFVLFRAINGQVVRAEDHVLRRYRNRFSVFRRQNIVDGKHQRTRFEFERHFLRQTALVHFEFRSDNDNGTAGVVNTLTQQVLTETALFTFQEIGK